MTNNKLSKNPKEWGKQRAWCFTVNNYKDVEAIQAWLTKNAKYAIFGREVGESGTPHLQGYCEFKSARVYSGVAKALENAHVEPRLASTAEPAVEYCKKEDKEFWEHGEVSAQGKRNDLDEVREALDDGLSLRQVIRTGVAKNYQGIRMAEKLLEIFELPRDCRPVVHWYWGKTGRGKSWTAKKEAIAMFGREQVYFANSNGKWFNGYDKHPAVIVDDLRYDWKKFADLLKFLDENPYRVETKGGMRQFVATHIWITCPRKPADEYKYTSEEDLQQLVSRCRTVREFSGENRRTAAMLEEAGGEPCGVPDGPDVSGPDVGEVILADCVSPSPLADDVAYDSF